MTLLEKEIEYLSWHSDLDKVNINNVLNRYFVQLSTLISVMVGLVAIIFSYDDLNNFYNIRILLILFIILICLLTANKINNNLKKDFDHHNLNLIVRENMLSNRYSRFGVIKDKLNKEFEKIKTNLKK